MMLIDAVYSQHLWCILYLIHTRLYPVFNKLLSHYLYFIAFRIFWYYNLVPIIHVMLLFVLGVLVRNYLN